MKSWRDRLSLGAGEISEMSAEGMAASRLMKGMGASMKDIGNLCRRFGIDYVEEESSFDRAVKIFMEVYRDARLLEFIDVKSGKTHDEIYDDLLDDKRTGIVFYRIRPKNGTAAMTAFVKGMYLMTSALGRVVIRPGARYISNKDGVELWEQDPVRLIKSFAVKQEGG